MFTPSRLSLFALAALAAGALTGCEAGTMDTGTGRFAASEAADKRSQDSQPPEAKPRNEKRDGHKTDDDGSAKDDARPSGGDTSGATAYLEAELDAQGEAEPLPEVLAHQGMSREYPELPPDVVIPESVAAAAAAAAAATEPDPNNAPVIDSVSPATAPSSGGSELQIHGKNLHAYRVAVGFAPARILAVQEAGGTVTLTVAAPPRTGPATVAVVVMNRDGSVAVASEPFQYLN